MHLWKPLFPGKDLCRENSTCPTHQTGIFVVNKVCSSAVRTEMLNFPQSQFPIRERGSSPQSFTHAKAVGQEQSGKSSTDSPDPPYSPGPGVWPVSRTQSSLLSSGLGPAPLPHDFMGHRGRSLAVLQIMTFSQKKGSGTEIPVFLSSPPPAYRISV